MSPGDERVYTFERVVDAEFNKVWIDDFAIMPSEMKALNFVEFDNAETLEEAVLSIAIPKKYEGESLSFDIVLILKDNH